MAESYVVWNVIFAGVVAAASIVSAITTWLLIRESKLLRQAQHDPHVSVYVQVSDRSIHLFELVVANDGGGPAYDVGFVIEQDFELPSTSPSRLGETFLNQPWTFLGVGRSRKTTLGSTLGLNKTDLDRNKARVNVTWRGADKRTFAEVSVIDLNEFMRTRGVGTSPSHAMAKEAEKITRALDRLVRIEEGRDWKAEEAEGGKKSPRKTKRPR